MAFTFDISKIYGQNLGKQYSDAVEEKEFSDAGVRLWNKTKLGTLEYLPVTLGGINIPHALISITGKKTIIETPMVGRAGTVKELISVDDYNIKITGLWINEDSNDFPEAGIMEFLKVWEKNEAIEIVNALTDLLLPPPPKGTQDYGQSMVVVKGYSLPEMQGVQNAQIIQIDCVTDQNLELEIK